MLQQRLRVLTARYEPVLRTTTRQLLVAAERGPHAPRAAVTTRRVLVAAGLRAPQAVMVVVLLV